MFIIDDSTKTDTHSPPGMMKGYVERDYSIYPVEMFAAPSEIPLIPRSDWDAIIQEQEEKQSSLEHIWRRKGIKHLDQNGQGFCWFYGTCHTVMAARARDNQETVRLSGHAGACKIKNFKDEGGWAGLGAEFMQKYGCPTVDKWKEKSMSRTYDTAETWEEAKQYRVTENYVDLTRPVWGRNLEFDQVFTCLLMNIPVQVDFNWWMHSVCAMRAVSPEKGAYAIRIVNTWPGFGKEGFADLLGNRAIPNGAVATKTVFTN